MGRGRNLSFRDDSCSSGPEHLSCCGQSSERRHQARQAVDRHPRLLTSSLIAVCLTAAMAASRQADGQFSVLFEHPAIGYGLQATHDPVAELNARLATDATRFTFEQDTGYLRSVLAALDLPAQSQVLVFSQTGIQGRQTNPRNPRALLFNDAVVAGYIRGAPLIELAALDSQQGIAFYTLRQVADERPRFAREARCLSCHVSLSTLEVPGMLVRSQFTSPTGASLRRLGQHLVDHRTPFEDRWGGFYVNGVHGSMRHMGNAMVTDVDNAAASISAATLNVRSLDGRVDLTAYPAASSDIVALMVFDHQMRMMNLLTRVGWEVRVAQQERRFDLQQGPVRAVIDDLVDYLLFIDEAPLPQRVEGVSGFAAAFARRGPRDKKQRSLRELDLGRRLMRYPCSYMIYADAFDGLPNQAKDAIYARLWSILSGQERAAKYARLTKADRQSIVEILRDTKPGLPPSFNGTVQ